LFCDVKYKVVQLIHALETKKMTGDTQVTTKLFGLLKVKKIQTDGLGSKDWKGLNVAALFDITGYFRRMQGCTTWYEVLNQIKRKIYAVTDELQATEVVICADLLNKNEQRDFVGQSRPRSNKQFQFGPLLQKLDLQNPDHFPFAYASAQDIISIDDCYDDRAWRKEWLYQIMDKYLLPELRNINGQCPNFHLCGFTDQVEHEAMRMPVEGDFQIVRWSAHFLVRDFTAVMINEDSDQFTAAMIQMDNFEVDIARNWFWYRPTTNSSTLTDLYAAYTALCKDTSVKALSGARLAALIMARGNDYVNCASFTPNRFQPFDVMAALTKFNDTVGVIDFAVDENGVYTIDVMAWAIFISKFALQSKTLSLPAAIMTAAQTMHGLTYFNQECRDGTTTIKMLDQVEGKSKYGFVQDSHGNKTFTTDVYPSKVGAKRMMAVSDEEDMTQDIKRQRVELLIELQLDPFRENAVMEWQQKVQKQLLPAKWEDFAFCDPLQNFRSPL
jgi:hypothetical protein